MSDTSLAPTSIQEMIAGHVAASDNGVYDLPEEYITTLIHADHQINELRQWLLYYREKEERLSTRRYWFIFSLLCIGAVVGVIFWLLPFFVKGN